MFLFPTKYKLFSINRNTTHEFKQFCEFKTQAIDETRNVRLFTNKTVFVRVVSSRVGRGFCIIYSLAFIISKIATCKLKTNKRHFLRKKNNKTAGRDWFARLVKEDTVTSIRDTIKAGFFL